MTTNENMAEVMGWHEESTWWFTEDNKYAGFTTDKAGKASRQFNPMWTGYDIMYYYDWRMSNLS